MKIVISIIIALIIISSMAKDSAELKLYLFSIIGVAILFAIFYVNKYLKKNKTKLSVNQSYQFSLYSKVVGVTFDNDDGSSRQKNIKNYLSEGDELFVKGYSYKGSPAMAVLAKEDNLSSQVGNLGAELVEDIMNLPPDTDLEIRVKNLTGGTKKKPALGVNIEIFTSKKI